MRKTLTDLFKAAALGFVGFILTAHVNAFAQPAFTLSAAEKQYIDQHPVVDVASLQQYRPFYAINPNGAGEGITFDYLARLNALTGIKFNTRVFSTFAQARSAVQTSGTSPLMLAAISQTGTVQLQGPQADAGSLRYSEPYFDSPAVLIGHKDDLQTSSNFSLSGKKIAVVPGTGEYELLKKQYPDANFVSFSSSVLALDSLMAKQTDYYLGPLVVAQYYIEIKGDRTLEVRRQWSLQSGNVRFAFAEQNIILSNIINRALDQIDSADRARIQARWTAVRDALSTAPSAVLSEKDFALLRSLPPLKVGIDAQFAPYTFADKDGRPDGITLAYLEFLKRRVGLQVGEIKSGEWAKMLAALTVGDIDLLLAVAPTPERRERIVFVGPYATMPTAIVSRPSERVVGLANINGEKLAVIKDYFLVDRLRAQYPRLLIAEYPNMTDALLAVVSGEARAAVGNIEVVAQTISERTPGSLIVSGTLPDSDTELYFGLRKELASLAPILASSLRLMTESEAQTIRQRWQRTEVKVGVSQERIMQIGIPIALALGAIIASLLWGRRQNLKTLGAQTEREKVAREASQTRGRYIAVLGHEVRTPLTALVSAAESISPDALSTKDKNLLNAVRGNARSVLDTLNDILSWLRGGAEVEGLRPRPSAIAQLVLDTTDHFRGFASQKSTLLTVSVEPGIADMHMVDPIRLRQVIVNLLANALRHTDGGEVHLKVRAMGAPEAGKQRLQFICSDTGRGMPTEDIAKVETDPFETADLFGGGIGLALSRSYLQQMGSTLKIANDLTGSSGILGGSTVAGSAVAGSTVPSGKSGVKAQFELDLPVATQSSKGKGSASAYGRILIVDEDKLSAGVNGSELEKNGYRVDLCHDPLRALDIWASRRYSLVLLDLNLPSMDSLELVKMFRAFGADFETSIVGMTDDPSAKIYDRAIGAGANDVISKPIGLRELASVIGDIRGLN